MKEYEGSKVTLPAYQSEEGCMAHINTDEDKVHVSWMTKEGVVIVCEYIPENYPRCALITYKDIAEYKESLKDISSWFYSEFVKSWDEDLLGDLQEFIESGRE